MKAIYETDVAVLLARGPALTLSVEALRKLVARWRRAGLADARKLIVDRPRVVRLLSSGAALAGTESFRETSAITAYHQCDVSRVRLHLEGRPSPTLGRLTHWESERAFRADLDALGLASLHPSAAVRDRVHVPDGVATYEFGVRVAVEVERSIKAPSRLARIVEQLLTEYPVTLYAVADSQIRRAVLAAERSARTALERRRQVSSDRVGALSIIDIPREVV